ncbi:MAG: SDR family oxidoreductase [Chitinophagaceae bacterium]|jgi:3-oxoacyl-[acyl-carrier protein] reductase|nr:SDR family oxidoreductase [Chitinophagaceae bacterium]
MNISLTNKHALICGSTQGIGRATAMELAGLGATCTLMARNEAALQETLSRLPRPDGQTHHYVVADFSVPDTVRKAIAAHMAALPVHILVNNTGGPAAGPVTAATTEQFEQAFSQHLVCNHILAQACLPSMKAAGYGRIINIISTSVRIPLKNLGVSNTIRGAVASWAKTLSNEVAIHGITVNNILPGYTKTGRLDSLLRFTADKRGMHVDDLTREMVGDIPAGRFGEADEIANVAAFLASPAASYVNGVSIPVDGGRTGSI